MELEMNLYKKVKYKVFGCWRRNIQWLNKENETINFLNENTNKKKQQVSLKA